MIRIRWLAGYLCYFSHIEDRNNDLLAFIYRLSADTVALKMRMKKGNHANDITPSSCATNRLLLQSCP